MAAQSLQLKKLGFHILPTDDQLMARLRDKVLSSTDDDDRIRSKFPIVNRDLYYAEPWNVLKVDDPWEISDSLEKTAPTRKIYVFTTLNIVPGRKRAIRVAGKGTWSGSTGEKKVVGERPGSVIGTKSYFEYKFQQDPAVPAAGHWTMHEYKLGGESYKGLESIPHAKKLVLCLITHVADKELGLHLSWTKTPFKIRYEELKERGFFLKKRQQPEPAEDEHGQVEAEEVQNHNKRRKREDDAIAQAENQQMVLYDLEGGFNDQSRRAVDESPNLGEGKSEFSQLDLANSQNNLMSQEADTPSCSYHEAVEVEDPASYYDLDKLWTDDTAQPEVHPYDLSAPNLGEGRSEFSQLDLANNQNNLMSQEADTPSCSYHAAVEVEDPASYYDLDKLSQPEVHPYDLSAPNLRQDWYLGFDEQQQCARTSINKNNELVEVGEVNTHGPDDVEDHEQLACDLEDMMTEETDDHSAEENQQGTNVGFDIEEFARELLEQDQNGLMSEDDNPLIEENQNAYQRMSELLSSS